MTTQQKSDNAFSKMVEIADKMEVIFGERTNTETIKEGRTNFSFKVWFCTEDQKVTIKNINIKL